MHIQVFGLRLPSGETFAVDHDFVFQAIPTSMPSAYPDIYALFRVIGDIRSAHKICLSRLQKFAECYTFETGRAVRIVQSSYGYSAIAVGADLRLGAHGKASTLVLVNPEQARKELGNTVILSERSLPKYLQIALTFYARSRDRENSDEVLIDMITALESMFSLDIQELRYRLSLRAAYFLHPDENRRRKDVFDLIYAMYDLRSKILHGNESVSIGRSDEGQISQLHAIVRDAISRLVPLGSSYPTRKALVEMIDSRVIQG